MATSSPRIAEIEYLLEIAKDWSAACFASAQGSDFTLAPHRFELTSTGARRCRLRRGSPEAVSPLAVMDDLTEATVWSHTTVVTLLVDFHSDSTTTAIEQEMVEVLAVDGELVLADAAAVIRIPGLPPCLGPFGR